MARISSKKPLIGLDSVYKHYLDKVKYNPKEYDEKRDKPVHRASMGGRCHKLQKYHTDTMEIDIKQEDGTIVKQTVRRFEPKPLDYNTKKIFRIGELTHGELQEAFKWLIDDANADKDYYELRMEQKVTIVLFGLEIDGHYDAVLINHKTKTITVYDIKTMNPRAFSFFKKAPTSKLGYNIQLGSYVIDIKREFQDYDITVVLSAVSKDNSEILEVCLDEDSLIEDANNYYKMLATSMKMDINQIIPVQHPFSPMENWECNYCNYNHICTSPKITMK
jgi:hypothetical protein